VHNDNPVKQEQLFDAAIARKADAIIAAATKAKKARPLGNKRPWESRFWVA
jgi:ABC-type sugar transport system substrate-binding protein